MGASEIAERFVKTCRDRSNAVAVRTLWDGRSQSFGDLLEQYEAVQQALARTDAGPGSCVLSIVGNRPAFFPLFAACMAAGAVLLPLNDATEAEVASLVEQAGVSTVILGGDPGRSELGRGDAHEVPKVDGIRLVRLCDRQRPPRGLPPCSVLKLTSGSTNLPKAAIARESHLISDGCHIIEAMGLEARDINLVHIPLSHSYAIGNVVMPLIWQGTSVALRQTFNPSQFVQDALASGASVFPGVPFMFEHVQAQAAIDRLPSTLRLLITAGAPIELDTVAWFRTRLGRKVHSFYGSSETGGITYDDADDVSDDVHVGRPLPETMVDIHTSGRIVVSGPAVCAGYAGGIMGGFVNGGFLTEDLGRFDVLGRLVLTGRVSRLVNVAGRKVDPAEVERVLAGLPNVVDVRVLGMSCDTRGEQLVAFIVRSSSALTPVVIRQRCAGVLSAYKIPRRFVFLDRLPVDTRGKMDRRALEAAAAAL